MLPRARLKALLPASVRRSLERLRATLNGPGIEYEVLADYHFQADPDRAPRISLVMPDVSSSKAFGGVMTGIDLITGLSELLEDVEMRIVSETAPDPGDSLLDRTPALADFSQVNISETGRRLPVRAQEMFIAYNWWTSLNLEAALASQQAHFGTPPRPKIHLIQDYEPQFYGFSAAHLLARSAMGESWPLWGIFNSSELFHYWRRQGHNAEKTFVFEPMMSAGLRSHLNDVGNKTKTRTLLVYGRADVPRNAFYLVETGLKAWANKYGADHTDWRIVSAGTSHPDILLGAGHVLRSLGKLDLDSYAELLKETAVGLSLMVSPHPSYPPLEMAHFGALVVTNGYADKDLSKRHDNIVEMKSLRPEAIANSIESAIQRFEHDPSVGYAGKSHTQGYLAETRIECVDALAKAIREQISE